MAQRPQFEPFPSILNGDMSANITGLPTIVQKLSMISYSVSWVGSTPVGAISVQVSNDYSLYPNGSIRNAGTWNTITFNVAGSQESSIPISGNTGNGFIDIGATGAYAIRPVYTAGSGLGSLQVIIAAKVS